MSVSLKNWRIPQAWQGLTHLAGIPLFPCLVQCVCVVCMDAGDQIQGLAHTKQVLYPELQPQPH